ncbi:MAG: endolytic transglycosylase MltG [Candidatus Paceibacterota bacterium]
MSVLAKRAEQVLPEFDAEEFILLATPSEGRLFPDTYLLPEEYTAEELFDLLTSTFTEKLLPWQDEILAHNLSLDQIIILASIIEREANSPESKKMVSGILQQRLEIGMPLQADASVEYILDKPLKELAADDLKVDSPYNTYLNTGLPPTPIGNPGLDAIVAVLEPTTTDYLFYITGNDGEFYYAKDFDGHKLNIARYLR